ncbi:choline/glycine/proline betaine transport protein [Spinactinospora alkalitolerans]|uniref:Choline/glycine/proline betaine transport protein n=1 Tax=Spinactinospora alkalitolerans TaxID=687207 RepID=A0A852TWM2_9ACTN|nr:choline/glycine/proline betaine transport protein [Spinactinospora alkalitolerans]
MLFTDAVSTGAFAALDFIATYLGWFYIFAATGFLVFVLWIMLSRYGSIRLGPDSSRPEFGTTAWFAMLFTAGMGIGLVFYGVNEPTYHAANLPEGTEGLSNQALADQGMNFTLFHWGLHPWAIYIVLGLALGYFCFRKGLPMRPASALYPLIGNRIYGWPGHIVDVLAVFGTLFGLATSLGIGTQQIGAGLETLFGIPNVTWTQILIVALITAVAVASVMLGIDKGIRRLSVINLWLAVTLMVFVFAVGPKLFILTGLADFTGYYLQNLVGTSLTVYNPNTQPDAASWQAGWTLFYWGWWISWSPFVGMFIARISYGRTIRQFIVGTLFAPVGASIVWFSVFGGSGIFYDLFRGAGIAEAPAEQAVYLLLQELPIAGILYTLASVLTIVVVVLFFATSSDSGSLVVDMLTNGGDPHPIKLQRFFWAVTEGLVTMVLLVIGGAAALDALQAASITVGLPFAFVLILVCFGLAKALRGDTSVTTVSRLGRGGFRPGTDTGTGAEEVQDKSSPVGVSAADNRPDSAPGSSAENRPGTDGGRK